MRAFVAFSLLCLAGSALAQAGAPCAVPTSAPATSVSGAAPLAPELAAPGYRLGAPSGVLAQAVDEVLSVDEVLARVRLADCMMAKVTPGLDPGGYKPKTQFDNTPWRFDMNQNGKRMTADEFSAWMKAKGVRVARGAAPAAPTAAPAQGSSEPAPAPAPADGEKR